MSQWTPAIDTTDQDTWDDEGVALFIEHVGKEFEGSVGIFAKAATTSGDIALQRKALAMFMTEKLPGGKLALQELREKEHSNVPAHELTIVEYKPEPAAKPFTLEQWEDNALRSAANKAACVAPGEIEKIARRTGTTIDEARKNLWKTLFYGSLEDAWRPDGR